MPQSKLITFHLVSPEPRAILVMRNEAGDPSVIVMKQRRPRFWTARVELSEGTYHCRYYCGDEKSVTYHGPAHANGSSEDGLDAVVSIKVSVETPVSFLERMLRRAATAAECAILLSDFSSTKNSQPQLCPVELAPVRILRPISAEN
jgi:hypothetical protein